MSKKYPVYKFTYDFTIKKTVRIFGYSVPSFYTNIDEARADVKMISEYHDLFEKAKLGNTNYSCEIVYLPDEKGTYHPKIAEAVERSNQVDKNAVLRSEFEIIVTMSMWKILKMKFNHLFRKKKKSMRTVRGK